MVRSLLPLQAHLGSYPYPRLLRGTHPSPSCFERNLQSDAEQVLTGSLGTEFDVPLEVEAKGPNSRKAKATVQDPDEQSSPRSLRKVCFARIPHLELTG